MSIGIEDRANLLVSIKENGRKRTSSPGAQLIDEVIIFNNIQVINI